MLPLTLQRAALAGARGLDPGALLADLFLSYPPDDFGLDPPVAKWSFFVVAQTVLRYFRTTVLDAENIPPGRSIVVSTHSGVLPWDATCLVVSIYRHTGRFSRNAGHELWGRVPLLARYLARGGVVLGPAPDLEELLRRGEIVVIFPGGTEDMRRRIWQRYQVKPNKGFAPGRGGYIKVALRTGSPIVPAAIVGAEEVHMLLAEIPPLARLVGLPYCPIVISPFPLPARIYVRFGEPIHLDAPPEAAEDQALVDRLNEEVRATLQDLLDDTRRRRRGIYCSTYDGDGPPFRPARRRPARRSHR